MTISIERQETPEEIAEREAWAAQQSEQEKAEKVREKNRTAALGKLKKLGLTENEINALLG
jgi:hypothetical protein